MRTLAVWDANAIAELDREANLRNTCRQIEDEYVTWGRYVSQVYQRQWPMIGELHRYTVDGVVLAFVCHRHYVQVVDTGHKAIGKVQVHPGMASELYALAGTLADRVEVDSVIR